MKTILLLSPGLSQTRALAMWLKSYGSGIHVVGGYLSGEERCPSGHFFDTVMDIRNPADLEQFETVVPTGSISTEWLAKSVGGFRVGDVSFSAENLRVSDKPWLYDLARRVDIPIPETWLDFNSIPGDGRPVFYKPRREGVKGPRRRAANKDGVPVYARGKDFLFQEYIPGREVYGFGFISIGGKVVASCQHVEIASMPFDGGSAVAVRGACEQRLNTLSCLLLDAVKYDGWGLIEFKYCRRRRDFVLMELNAKWWASLEFALRCEPAFGRMLFRVEAEAVPLRGLFWPGRLLLAMRGNLQRGLHAALSLPWSWDRELPRPRSVLAGILPSAWVDSYRIGGRRKRLRHI